MIKKILMIKLFSKFFATFLIRLLNSIIAKIPIIIKEYKKILLESDIKNNKKNKKHDVRTLFLKLLIIIQSQNSF